MSDIVFACLAPHPPILLPSVGSEEDREQVKSTISQLEELGEELAAAQPKQIIISSPHPDWGFNVPLYFLAPEFSGEIKTLQTGTEDPKFYLQKGEEAFEKELATGDKSIALIASGDLSHRLKDEGPYDFHPDGEKFDRQLIELLKKKDAEGIAELNRRYPEAGECGLRSFCFLLGILEGRRKKQKRDHQPHTLSYEGPFGVGYLVAKFQL